MDSPKKLTAVWENSLGGESILLFFLGMVIGIVAVIYFFRKRRDQKLSRQVEINQLEHSSFLSWFRILSNSSG